MATAAQLNAQRLKEGVTTKVVTDPTRTASAQNAAAQNANAATKGTSNGSNPNAQLVQSLVQQNYTKPGSGMANELTPEQYADNNLGLVLADAGLYAQKTGRSAFTSPFVQQPYTPPGQDPGVIEQLRTLRQQGMEGGVENGQVVSRGVNIDQQGNLIGVATPQQITQNQLNLKGIMNATEGLDPNARQTAFNLAAKAAALDPANLSKTWDGESTESYQARQADIATQQAVVLQQLNDQMNRATQSQVRNANTNALGQQPGQQQQPTQPGAGEPGQTQTPAPQYDPLDPAASLLTDTANRLAKDRDAMLDSIGVTDPTTFAEDKADAKAKYKEGLDIADEVEADAKARAEEKQRKSLAENQRANALSEAMNAESILDQMKTNEETEVQARRRINKLSGGHDFSGVKYVQKNIQDGKDALHFLQLKAGIMAGQFADKAIGIINDYSLDMSKADIDKKVTYNDAYNTYTTELNDIRDDLNKDSADKAKLRSEAHKWYSEELTKIDFQHGSNLNSQRLKAIDRMNTLDKIRATTENNEINQAIKMLALSTKKGVQLSPEAMAAFEKQVAPNLKPGWMAQSTAGSGTGAGASYKHWTPEGLTAAQQWVVAQPGRSFNDLGPADQEWLVPFNTGSVPGGPQAPMGPTRPGESLPFNPFSQIEQQKATSLPTYAKEFDEIEKRTGSAPIGINGQPMTLQEYIAQRSFNYSLQQGRPTTSQSQTVIQQQQQQADPADDIISSDEADSFDFK